MAKFGKYWLATVSTLGSLVTLWAGIINHGPVPSWLWIVIAYLAFAFGWITLFFKEHGEVKKLEGFLIKEYVELIDREFKRRIHGQASNITTKFLLENIQGDEHTLKKAVVAWKVKYAKERQARGLTPPSFA